jgi:hypothetical protein
MTGKRTGGKIIRRSPIPKGANLSLQLRLIGAGTWTVLRERKQIGTIECKLQHSVHLLTRKDQTLSVEEKIELDKLILGLQYRQASP